MYLMVCQLMIYGSLQEVLFYVIIESFFQGLMYTFLIVKQVEVQHSLLTLFRHYNDVV